MNYGSYPKGMIKFHKYDDGHKRTAFEEHFHEGAMYAQKDGKVRIHFTIPEETADDVKQHLQSLEGCIGKMHNVEYLIDTSLQKPSTDTPALYADDQEWVRVEDGSLLFRPAGHGALLENLNDLGGRLGLCKEHRQCGARQIKRILPLRTRSYWRVCFWKFRKSSSDFAKITRMAIFRERMS